MKKRLLSLLLAIVMVLGMIPLNAMATEASDVVYISVSYDGQFKTDVDGQPLAHTAVPLSELEKIDLDRYGLSDYKYDADNDGSYEITALHLFIYVHETLCGESWDGITVSGGAGSIFFESGLFDFPSYDLNYYYNGSYPIDEAMTAVNGYATGATADHLVLKDGDFLDVAGFSNDSFMIYSATFRYFTADGQPVKSYSATVGEALEVNICTTERDWSTNETIFVPESDTVISYSQTLLAEDAATVTADADGKASITFDQAGTWYIWSNGYNDGTVSCTPAFATVEVTGGEAEQPEEPAPEEPAGQFALMAVNADGFVIEPSYVSYAEGATIKEALKNSGHTFAGIDGGFISAINGKVDNYSLHYDGDGYSLDTEASKVTAIWFTTNSSQAYSDDLLNLVSQMAKYNTSTNGVKDYTAAQKAYTAAAESFYQTSNAANLYKNLQTAMEKYDAFQSGTKVPVTMQITQGGEHITTGKAVFTSEFGTTTETTSLTGVELIPGTYDFVISDGTFRYVRGSIEVKEEAVLTAAVPSGKWIQSLELSMASGTSWAALPKANVTDGGATFYVPDYADYSLYPYVVRNAADTESDSSHKIYNGNSTSARTWASNSTALVGVIEEKNLDNLTLVIECRQTAKDANGYELYQTFTIDIQRVPTLEALSISGDGTHMKLDYSNTTFEYAVTTTSDTLEIAPTALSEGAAVSVNGKAGVSGQTSIVKLSDCTVNADGTYSIPMTVSAPNGQSSTYTITVTKVESVSVTVTHDADVSVEIMNAAGSVIAPTASEKGSDSYKLIPGESYTYVTTKNTYYHATASFTAGTELTVTAATPKTQDWATDIAGRASAAASSELTPDFAFAPADHSYTFQVESNTSAFRLKAASESTSTYAVTVYYTSHENSAYSSKGGTLGSKDYTKEITSNTSYTILNNSMSAGGWGNSLRIEYKQKTAVNGVTYYQDYFVELVRAMTMNSMSAADNNGVSMPLTQEGTTTTKFEKLIYDYTAKIGAGAQEMSLTFKPLSSYKYDSDFIVTLTCSDWSQRIEYSADIAPNAAQTVTVPLSGTMDTDTVCVTVSHKDSTSIPQTYTIAVSKLPPVNTTFTVAPADATVFLTDDTSGGRVYPEADGTYILNTEASYTYVITRNGYVAQTASFIAGEANKTITVNLEKAPESSYKDISTKGDWLQFRADNNNNGVVNVKTPIKAEDAVLEWANKIGEGFDSGATGCPIIVGGYIYTYAGKSIVKVNKDTGEVVANGVMIGSSSFAINSPTYADGMLFVGLSSGRVQAFNAQTLESLWVFQDALGGQPNCPIVYCDGYVYTGFWNSETKQAHFVCLSVTDEDTANTTESKLPTWTYTHNGFYWAGAYACEDFVLIGTDDGDSGYTNGYASILSLDPKTGILLDEEKLPNVGDQRSSICYDAVTAAYYFTTKGGDFYQVRVNADGTFTENSLRRLHLDNGSDNVTSPPMSTSTPVIYNGRAYIGVSGTSQFGAYSGHNMTVIDLETFSIAYSVPTMGYPQTSGLLTTAYEDADGYVYVYFVDNYTPGMVRVIRDKKGMTEVDHSYTSTATVTVNGQSTTIETGYILFSPYGDEAQYAICSPIADSEGNLYFKNDSARMMRLSSRMTSLEIAQQPEKKDYCVGKTFDGTGMKVIAHYANGSSKDVTQYVSFTTDPLTVDDTEITVSFAPDKMFEKNTTAAGGYWQWYRDVDGTAGQTYYLPTATVNITINSEHSFTNYKSNNDATCEADGTKTATCDHCDATDTQTDVGSAKGHKMGEFTVTKEPTYTTKGEKTATCTVAGCGYTVTEEIPLKVPPYTPGTPPVVDAPVEKPVVKPVVKPVEKPVVTPVQPINPSVEVTVPVSGNENTVHVEASVSGTTATVDTVDMSHLYEVIGDHVETGTVSIDFSHLNSSHSEEATGTEIAPIDTVKIPAEMIKKIAEAVADPENDAESLEIVLSDGTSIEFDAAALAEKVSQANGADITISIKHATVVDEVLTSAQKQTVGSRVAFDISVTSGGTHISDMGGKIIIHAPYELAEGETAEGIVVYYVDDAGNREKCVTTYDSVTKRVNWETNHLSVYMIDHEVPVDEDIDDGIMDENPAESESNIAMWIVIGLAASAAIVILLIVIVVLKKRRA